MSLRYMLEHVEISMIITAAIGMLGMIYEPGPVPSLMALIGGAYLIAYWIGMTFFSFIKYERRARNKSTQKPKKAPRKPSAKCYFYDLKKEA